MPKAYVKLTVKFKSFWMWLMLIGILSSALLGAGTYIILSNNQTDCAGIRIVTWCLFVFHIVNGLYCAMALCGLEKKICSQIMLTGFILFDVILLIWTQVTYFYAQGQMCNIAATTLYFWLMFEIMFFYALTAFIVCYFFRRFCQDPALQVEEEEEEARERRETLSKTQTKSDVEAHGTH